MEKWPTFFVEFKFALRPTPGTVTVLKTMMFWLGSEDTGFICRGCFSLTVRNFLNLVSSKTVLCNSIGIYFISVQDQYVFLHQAVMEALVCGNTEIIPQDLRIATNKLAKVHKPSKKTGYERELKASDNYSQKLSLVLYVVNCA